MGCKSLTIILAICLAAILLISQNCISIAAKETVVKAKAGAGNVVPSKYSYYYPGRGYCCNGYFGGGGGYFGGGGGYFGGGGGYFGGGGGCGQWCQRWNSFCCGGWYNGCCNGWCRKH